jgi:hypothetical protein
MSNNPARFYYFLQLRKIESYRCTESASNLINISRSGPLNIYIGNIILDIYEKNKPEHKFYCIHFVFWRRHTGSNSNQELAKSRILVCDWFSISRCG